MRLYDSKIQKTEEFSLRDSEITLNVCGITPYDTTRVWHAFTYTAYDQFIRYLEMKGIHARYAQNVTDIDDDILKKAKETGEYYSYIASDVWFSTGEPSFSGSTDPNGHFKTSLKIPIQDYYYYYRITPVIM